MLARGADGALRKSTVVSGDHQIVDNSCPAHAAKVFSAAVRVGLFVLLLVTSAQSFEHLEPPPLRQ
jgi:hypothetical protein